MGRPLGSKNKPRSVSQDSQRPKKRVVPILVRKNEEDECTPSCVDDLNEKDRFTYIPRTREVRPAITLLPSDRAPRSRRYTILDRVEDDNEIPRYILREDVASNSPQNTSLDSPQSQRTPSLTSDLKLILLHNGSVRNRPIASPHTSQPIPDYDPDDPSLLRISLLYIDNFVSPRQVEEYENKRFANPKPEDDPFAGRRRDTASQSSASSGRRSAIPQEEVREKKPVGRPPKKRRLLEAVVINNAMRRSPLSGSSISGSEPSENQSINGIQAMRREDVEADVDMLDSIEGDGSIPESDVEETLRAFFPNRIPDPSPRRSTRSISTVESQSSIAPLPLKSPMQISQSPSSGGNTRSRATSYVSAQSSKRASRSASVLSSVHAAPPTKLLPPAPITKSSSWQKSSLTNQRPRPEVATADLAKQLIAQQFGTSPKSRLQPTSPKRVSKPIIPSAQSAASVASSSLSKQKQKPGFRPNFTQSKLSFVKAQPRQKSPSLKLKPRIKREPTPPPAEEDEDEGEDDEPEYEVSKILSHHDNEFGRYYRVAWKGFPDEESTYLTEEELGGARKLLKKYKKRLRKMEKGGSQDW
jgi:hypothetical protein